MKKDLFTKGEDALHHKKYDKAISIFTKEINRNDIDLQYQAKILLHRSFAFLRSKDLESALADAIKATNIVPTCPQCHLQTAEVYLASKKYSQAMNHYERATDLFVLGGGNDHCNYYQRLIQLKLLHCKESIRLTEDSFLIFKQFVAGVDYCKYGDGRRHHLNPLKSLIHNIGKGMQNAVYIVGDRRSKQCVIVDACWDVASLNEFIEANELIIKGCIATHWHFDHVGGRPPGPFSIFGIKVPGMLDIIKKYNCPVYVHVNEADFYASKLNIPIESICAVQEGSVLRLGNNNTDNAATADGINITFLHTPGHTSGSISLLVNSDRLLTGDLLFCGAHGRFDLPGGSLEQLNQSLERLSLMSPDIVIYPGHTYRFHLTSLKIELERGCLRKFHTILQNNSNGDDIQ